MGAETISISSDSSGWANYFPPIAYSSSSSEVDSVMNQTPKETAKQEFANRTKVLGLGNKITCAKNGIKVFEPKKSTEASATQKGKGKKNF